MSQSVLFAKLTLREAKKELLAVQNSLKAIQGKLASPKKGLDATSLLDQLAIAERKLHHAQAGKDLAEKEYLSLLEEARVDAAFRMAAVQERELQRDSSDRVEYEAAVGIKMLSGDIHAIGIRWDWNIAMLKDSFLRTMGYNPSVADRVSLVDADGLPPMEAGVSWKEKYESVEEIPLLYAFIDNESVLAFQPKLKLIHSILKDKNIRTTLVNDEIWSLYSSWVLTYRPQGRANRYIKLLDFVLAHPEVFIPLTTEEILEEERVEQEKQEKERAEQKVRAWIQFREAEIRYVQRRSADPVYLQNKERLRNQLISILQLKPDWSVVGDSVTTKQTRQIIRHHFTIQELVDLGMKPEHIATRWEVVEWLEMAALADAYEADHPPCEECGKYH